MGLETPEALPSVTELCLKPVLPCFFFANEPTGLGSSPSTHPPDLRQPRGTESVFPNTRPAPLAVRAVGTAPPNSPWAQSRDAEHSLRAHGTSYVGLSSSSRQAPELLSGLEVKPSTPLKCCRGSQDARACPSKDLEGKGKALHFNESRGQGRVGLRQAFPEPQPRKVAGQNMICEVAPNYILPLVCLCFDLGPSARLPPV